MSIYNFFRNIFGVPNISGEGSSYRYDSTQEPNPNEFRNPIWNIDEDDDDDDDFRHAPNRHFGFNIDSDPIGIHQFFEQQMEEMMRSFGMLGMFGSAGFPALDQPPLMMPEQGRKSLREQVLKPGYDTMEKTPGHRKMDSDLDDRINAGELGAILQQRPSLEPRSSFSRSVAVPGFSGLVFGKSVTSKMVRRPDGTVEHHHTVKDNQGNEKTTVTRQLGDQSYSVTTQKDASGEERCTKNLVNIDEENLQEFEKKWGIK